MADLAFVGLIVAFFALTLLLVRGCERIIGSEEPGLAVPAPAGEAARKRELAA